MRPETVLGTPQERSSSHERRGTARAIVVGAVAALAILAFYVVVYPIKGVEVALGSDTPVYVWWARRAGALGLTAFQAGSRPGFTAAFAALSDVLRMPAASLASAIGPVLATSLGFVVAAFVDLSLGRDPLRFILSAVFAATFLSLLVAGYFSTLAFGLLFIAALTCLLALPASGSGTKEDRAVRTGSIAGAVLLITMAGMNHPQFLVVGAAVVAGSVLALLPGVRRDREQGLPLLRTKAGITTATFLAGAAAGLGAVAAIGPEARTHVDTSRDAILRRLRLQALSRESYREVLRRFFPWFRVLTVGGLAATPLLVRERLRSKPRDEPDQRRLFWGAMAGWGAVTIISVVGLIAGLRSPGQRLAAFCLPLPILAAIGLGALHDRFSSEQRTALARGIVVLGSGLFVIIAFLGWGKLNPLISGDSAAQVQTAGTALARQPRGTPLIVVVHDFMGDPGIRTTRYTNYLRAAVPPARMTDVHLFWGTPRDFLARRPTLIRRFEHDRLAKAYWNGVRRVLARQPLAVAFRGLDPQGFTQALRLGGRQLAPGVAVLPGFAGSTASGPLPSEWTEVGAGPISPWVPVWLSPALLILLAAIGWPLARISLRRVDPAVTLSLAPAFALAALGLVSWIVDAVGVRLATGGGILAAALTVVAGVAGWIGSRATSRDA